MRICLKYLTPPSINNLITSDIKNAIFEKYKIHFNISEGKSSWPDALLKTLTNTRFFKNPFLDIKINPRKYSPQAVG